jgi:hypothetical protein
MVWAQGVKAATRQRAGRLGRGLVAILPQRARRLDALA